MSYAEVIRLIGEPSSITDTAITSTAVWVFKPDSAMAMQSAPKSYSGLWVAIGNIATVAGAFVPGVGLAASVSTQVYNANEAANQTSVSGIQTIENETRMITVEFREGKAFSIQRSKPTLAPRVSMQ